ncbi:tetratricopeptide repeat protein [Latilactobacillus graminis]|uniref:Tetratricopeptide repeat family protein n=2 Tax=Latilactobacillus graminis TaxID=60519 RepID=A0AA89I1K8_9LACO|nr:tetratricopeptide repeat protein [Latilactobacillus graminis]KRM23863.1 tetratricopeptide repeat family protein [Latilactobacillus graminis DSM 20719]QFP79753.1 tetratricopeptide repeat protein [Latilactobacillus graminis]
MQAILKKWAAGEHEVAVKELVQYLQEQPDDIEAYVTLATFLTTLKDFEQAEVLLQKALTQFPKENALIYALGTLYYQAEAYQQAAPLFMQLVQDSQAIDAQYMLAQTYHQLEQNSRALVFALTVQEQQPDQLDVNLLVGDILTSLGDFDQAQTYLKNALTIDPRNGEVLFKYGLTQLVLGATSDIYFEQAKQYAPDYFQKNKQQLIDIEGFMQAQAHKE